MRRICVDMDEVMADTLAERLRRYNQAFDEDITTEDLAGKGLSESAPLDRQQQIRAFLDAEDFLEDLPLMPDAQRVLRSLSARFEIFIATQAMAVPNSLGPKYRWLQRHFPFVPPAHYVFCGDKSILRADFLIDDQPRNLQRFAGQGLLYSAPHNLATTGSPGEQLAGSGAMTSRNCPILLDLLPSSSALLLEPGARFAFCTAAGPFDRLPSHGNGGRFQRCAFHV